MHLTKQQAINRYLEHATTETNQKYNSVDDVVWVNADKVIAILKEHALLKDTVEMKLPPKIEADWDTNDTKEFDRLLYNILVKKPIFH